MKYHSCLLLLALLSLSPATQAQPGGSITLFGQAGYSDSLGNSSIAPSDERQALAADLLGVFDWGPVTLLAEGYREGDESNLERLKLGFQLGDDHRLWLGKLHNPGEYWLQLYHRGYHVQPSVTEPFSSFNGYQGGITAKNLSGIRLDSSWSLGSRGILQSYLTLADTPKLSAQMQDPDVQDFFDNSFDQNLLWSARLDYSPSLLSDTRLGIAYSRGKAMTDENEIDAAFPFFGGLLSGTEFYLRHTHAFANLQNDTGRVLLALSKMHLDLDLPASVLSLPFIDPASRSDEYLDYGYLHGEYYLSSRWTLFARFEQLDTASKIDDPSIDAVLASLSLQREYDKRILGLRYDPARNHSFQLQYSNEDNRQAGPRNNIHLTWNFVLDWGF